MSRRILFSTMTLCLIGLVGCRAQDERRNLQNSVTRLEQRLTRMDEYLKSMQDSQAQQTKSQVQTLQDREKEVAKLTALLRTHEHAMNEQQAAQKAEVAGLRSSLDNAKKELSEQRSQALRLQKESEQARRDLENRVAAERAAWNSEAANREQAAAIKNKEIEARLAERNKDAEREVQKAKEAVAAAKGEIASLRQQLDRAKDGTARGSQDHRAAIEKLSAERAAIEKMHKTIQREHEQSRRQADEAREREESDQINRLENENRVLSRQLAQMRRELSAPRTAPAPLPAPAQAPMPTMSASPTGSIIVNNEEGEVHFHFHGPAPAVIAPAAPTPPPKAAAEPATRRRGALQIGRDQVEFAPAIPAVPALPARGREKAKTAEGAKEAEKATRKAGKVESGERKINDEGDAVQSLAPALHDSF